MTSLRCLIPTVAAIGPCAMALLYAALLGSGAGHFTPALAATDARSDGAAAASADRIARAPARAPGHPFVANGGQWPAEAAFGAPTFAGALFVTRAGELVHSLPAATPNVTSAMGTTGGRHEPRLGWVLVERFVDAIGRMRAPMPVAGEPAVARVQYVSVATTGGRALDTCETVVLPATFDGIDVTLRATGLNVEKIFTVAPKSDPATIRVRIDGADGVALGVGGDLVVKTGNGDVTFSAPIAFQVDASGRRRDVDVAYALDVERATYGFRVGTYDRSRALVIDPLLKSTYVGATGSNFGRGIAVHPVTGDVYIAGRTGVGIAAFPGTTGGVQASYRGGLSDGYIARYNAALTSLQQATYFGGGSDDMITAMAFHPVNGDLYVAGQVGQSAVGLPSATGAQPASGGGLDGFVARLTPSLTTVVRSTYLGGSDFDGVWALAIHPATGDVYVTGMTQSTSGFPAGGGATLVANATGDGFVTRLDANLGSVLGSTLIAGSGFDVPNAIAIHPINGDVYIAGQTDSTDLPLGSVTGRPAVQGSNGGGIDAFVARFAPDLATLRRATYLGGTDTDFASALLVHPSSGEVYVAGTTQTSVPAFPGVTGGARPTHAGQSDAFVTRLDDALGSILQSTYLGTLGADSAAAIVLHPVTGELYVAGSTSGIDAGFPGVAGGAQALPGGGSSDGFISRLRADLRVLNQSTFVGGALFDEIANLAIHPLSGEVLVVGGSAQNPVNFTARVAAKASTANYDTFVARFSPDLRNDGPVPPPFAFAPKIGVPPGTLQQSDPVQLNGLSGLAPIAITGGAHAQFCLSSGPNCNCDAAAFSADRTSATDGQYVCVRQQAPLGTPGINAATVAVEGRAAVFVVTTGNLVSACSLDIDGNGALDALTDAMLLMRALFGSTGSAVTDNAVGPNATRSTWAQVKAHLNGNCGGHF